MFGGGIVINKISIAVIKRLPRYYRYLGDLLDDGIVRISSKELSEKMKVTASQIRQDLNNFGGFGQQGYGYNVETLYEEIGKILGLEKKHSLVIIGAGNLGQAIIKYTDFEKRGFIFKGVFDSNPKVIGNTMHNIIVQDVADLKEFIKSKNIQIAVLTIPKSNAPELANDLEKWGIKAIWNFAPVDLNVSDKVTVENVHLSDSLMTLSYKLKDAENKTKK
ncbi:MAG: rex [Clostridiales bacterium]|jgi:redox-sensing transcriptional repressor|nr:rex [Clostridiales bacterium]